MQLRVTFGQPEGTPPIPVLRLWMLISDVVNQHKERLGDAGVADGLAFEAQVESPVLARGFLRDLAPALRTYIDAGCGRSVTVTVGDRSARADRADDVARVIEQVGA